MEAIEKVLNEILNELKLIESKIDDQNARNSTQIEDIQKTLESIEEWQKKIYKEI